MTEQQRIESIKKNGGTHLKNFKAEHITYNMCLAAVQSYGEALLYVPKDFRTMEIYEEACKHGGHLYRVPQECRTSTMCKNAVSYYGFDITSVPQEFMSADLCLTAVISMPEAFQCIPAEYITPEFCYKVIQEKGIDAIKSLPESCKTATFYKGLIELCPEALWVVPKKSRSAKLCRIAIQQLGYTSLAEAVKEDPTIMAIIPSSLFTQEACLQFVQSAVFSEYYQDCRGHMTDSGKYDLPKMLVWKDVAEAAVRTNGFLIQFVKDDVITEAMSNLAMSQNSSTIHVVPKRFLSKEIYEDAYWHNPYFGFSFIPDEYKTAEICRDAVKKSPYNLKDVPDHLKTQELCELAVHYNGYAFQYVPEKFITEGMSYEAIDKSVFNLKYVPRSLIDQKMCDYAFAISKEVYSHIPNEYLTEEMCLILLKQDERDLRILNRSMERYRAVPFAKFGHAFYEKAVDAFPQVFRHIPDEEKTLEICIKAVKADWRLLACVPTALVNQEMCMAALNQSPLAKKNFPEYFKAIDENMKQ